MIPPSTFEQSQSRFFGILLAAAGICVGIGAVALVVLLVWGGWPATLYGQIVTILGLTLGGALAILLYVIHALAIGGPVKNTEVSISRDGASFKTEGDE